MSGQVDTSGVDIVREFTTGIGLDEPLLESHPRVKRLGIRRIGGSARVRRETGGWFVYVQPTRNAEPYQAHTRRGPFVTREDAIVSANAALVAMEARCRRQIAKGAL